VPETWFQFLSAGDRRDALRVAQDKSHRRAFLIEKDIWVVAALEALFSAPFAAHLTFKGGTSLSKVWNAIDRFSEDVDITYDIRAFAPDLVAGAGDEALPASRSQQKRWTQAIRSRLVDWVGEVACPAIGEKLAGAGFTAGVHADRDRVFIRYTPLFEQSGMLRPEVMVEFGARSTGEPRIVRPVVCDAAAHLPELGFPEANPAVMRAERTFWEKATAIHVFCLQQRRRGERLSRHWHDLARLDDAGIAEAAIADRDLALAVARHKAMFFSENDADGRRVDYEAAVTGSLRLLPPGDALAVLSADYDKMLADGMLLNEDEPFELLMERCARIEQRANRK